jgi:hypothetical protein
LQLANAQPDPDFDRDIQPVENDSNLLSGACTFSVDRYSLC